MKLRSEEFSSVKYNNKIMEVRLNDEKRRKINVGDKIIFYRLPELTESVLVKVKRIYKFLTFKELYDRFPSSYFGYGNLDIYQILNKIYSIYSPRQEKEKGVVAIMFQVEKYK
ncbi:ASCH domain-containing protein [Clostridium tyrobutyricum]|nr:ASCH domain-containing protein [Clostridium tyrobutyricum]ANP70896.1 hypothetical protein BA182_10450 [Clostridium tyrobutyricum]